MLILVDAMGGDNAPGEIVKGCIDAVKELDGFDILLIGDSNIINKLMSDNNFVNINNRIKIHHTSEVINNTDLPAKVIKSKKDSSMVVGFNLLKEKKGDVFISAGNSGALMAGALLILGRIKGVDRPALAAMLPTKKGKVLLIDAGLNTICKPINYQQFGIMGSIYMKEGFDVENPRVGLINVGSEETKGNDTTKQAYTLMTNSGINFVGNIEGKDIAEGVADIAVCDGFVGNVILKFLEGTASFFMSSLKNIFNKNITTKIAALFIKKHFIQFKKRFDQDENGGAPILGVNGIVLKSHGSSNSKTIKHVVIKAYSFAKTSVLEQIKDQFKNMEVEEIEQ